MKQTAVAPSNIAFIKYWGKKDEILRLPANGSISMNLSNLLTTTTVEFDERYEKDDITIEGSTDEQDIQKAIRHLDRVREKANIRLHARVSTKNNFPSSTGLSSSASGFAALTLAAVAAAGLVLSEKDLSILARMGSGSACRSIPSGFVEWLDGDSSQSSYAVSLFPPSYWDIVDLVAVVSKEKKEIPTTEGHKLAATSPFFQTRSARMPERIKQCKEAIVARDFSRFGELAEQEALEMHAIMLTSHPPLIYWLPTTVVLMKQIRSWRRSGLEAYFTINTGQDVHILCEHKNQDVLMKKLQSLKEIQKIIPNTPSGGATLADCHLF